MHIKKMLRNVLILLVLLIDFNDANTFEARQTCSHYKSLSTISHTIYHYNLVIYSLL